MKRKLCQGCMCLEPEKELHIPHEHEHIEKDVEVCAPCFRRISKVIEANGALYLSVVGHCVLGIKTALSRFDYSQQYADAKGLSVEDYFRELSTN